MMQSPLHIAVIGAGMAGLSCATHLQQQGLKVSVFEKSRGSAGRMSTRRTDNWQCDHGAQYFTARDPAFRAALTQWQAAGVAGLWTPRLQVLGDAASHNTGQGIERYVGVPGMTAPARWMAASLDVQTQMTIKSMRRTTAGWQLYSDEQAWSAQFFDVVLLAVPAPQAVPLLEHAAPDLALLAGGATMHACWAMMLHFKEKLALPFDAAFVNQGPLRWIARDSSKPGRGAEEVWSLQASAEWSDAHVEDEADSVAASLLQAFTQLGGVKPATWSAHRWRYANTEPALRQVSAWSPEQGLGLCGDWLNGGKVEGAWLSGAHLANQALQSLR
jgi:predicted NAD/FAD-dependent oxidoreductase